MIRFAIILSIVAFFAISPLRAQTVGVRSGEHDGFTRIVLDLPEPISWRVDQPVSDRVDLYIDRNQLTFSLSGVFDRIDRTRIRSISTLQDSAGISFELACACEAEAFLLGSNMLVVDFSETGLAGGEVEEPPKQEGEQVIDQPRSPKPEIAPLLELRVGTNAGIGPSAAQSGFSFSNEANPVEDQEVFLGGDLSMTPGAFEQLLSEQLATAATDGLLEPSIRRASRSETAAGSSESTGPKTGDSHAAENDLGRGVDETIEAQLRKKDPSDRQPRIRIGGSRCLPDQALNVGDWGDDNTLTIRIPELRRGLFGEFDQVNLDALVDLAEAYVRIGFGAEARALLDLQPDLHEPVLTAMAGIVDGGNDVAGVFAGQTGCSGFASLWALAGSVTLPEEAAINDKAIRLNFEKLPIELRLLLGPKLATRLAEEGRADSAKDILTRLMRATGDSSPDVLLSEARVERSEGEVHEAASLLRQIAEKSGAHGPDAVAEAIEIASELGNPISEELTALSGAYSTELRGSEAGPKLWLAHIRAITASGEYATGFSELWMNPTYPEPIRSRAANDALELLVEHAPTNEFLRFSVGQADRFDGLVSEDVVLEIAERILGLGLPEEAMRWLSFDGLDETSRAFRILRARVHLSRSEPEETELALLGLEGKEVLRLRAEAREMMRDYDYASSAYAFLGEEASERRAAWLGGDWTALDDGEDSISAAAGMLRQEGTGVPEGLPSLAATETLLGSSQTSRDTLRELLDYTRISDP